MFAHTAIARTKRTGGLIAVNDLKPHKTGADYENIKAIIDSLNVHEVTKKVMLDWAWRKENGDEEGGEALCKMAKALRQTNSITPEQHALIITFARRRNGQGGGRPSGSGLPEMWKKLKQWLREFFSLE